MTGPATGPATWSDDDLAPDGPVSVERWLGAPALSFPNRPANVLDAVGAAVDRWPDAVFGIDPDGAETTYAELGQRVCGTANAWSEGGVRGGDAVAVAATNSTAYAVALLAAAARGAVLVGLSSRLAPPQWAWMLEHSGVRLAMADPSSAPALAVAAAQAGLAPSAVMDLQEGTSARAVGVDVRSGPPIDETTTYQLVYTSGTTGRPKASRVVHRCSVHSAMAYQRVLQLRPDERTAVLFNLGYISAMHAHVLPAVLAGATCVWAEHAHPRRWVQALADHRVAWAYAVPSWWQMALREKRFDGAALPALRLAGAGGAPLRADLVTGMRQRLPGVGLLDVYGLSETHSPATMLLPDDIDSHAGTVGRPLPCMEVAIRDGVRDLGAGEAGEVWLRGSLVTSGYAGDEAATSDAVRDGWFRTGDVGRVDGDGYLVLLDRVKDMVNRAGVKVFSAEVERVLREHAAVADAAVVAAPDRLAGETVVAFVVPGTGPLPSAAELRRWVRERLGDAASPSAVHVVDALPRGVTGKTDKMALRAWLGTLS